MKHFIHLNDFSKQEIIQIFELADKLKVDKGECDLLKGKTIVLFFPESSIRSRVSFEKGIKMLGGVVFSTLDEPSIFTLNDTVLA